MIFPLMDEESWFLPRLQASRHEQSLPARMIGYVM